MHPHKRKRPCRNGQRCRKRECDFLHPIMRPNACPSKERCRRWRCPKWHPKRRPDDCSFGEQCYNGACKRVHPPERQVCPTGLECKEFECQLGHPPTRATRCDEGSACDNFFCESLHPDDWDPCEQGGNCEDPRCPHTNHPANRILHVEERADGPKPRDNGSLRFKSIEQRQIERAQAPLPIFAVKDEFCQRLQRDRLLIVKAETGSGKSTQLPQYAAEFFGGLVVCTQPRVIAAISLARRVADEYDGTSVGYSVGYRVGHANVGRDKNRVPGTDILYMTDGTFIQESQRGPQMDDIRVLIIDEAHERSLNTDLVMGIAKGLLESRQKDFYVVISSATIDVNKFLEFFERTNEKPLQVPGRVYPVTVEYIPKLQQTGRKFRVRESIEERVVSTILQRYDQHQGNIVAFFSGQREIENAIELFQRKAPNNCTALPLYSSLSPEEQDLVLKFDEGPNKENRMVVFCTNIAETSLTIKGVSLVIDSGKVNEGVFDYENRLNMIEATQISGAAAEQRRGRAGRTIEGHCVRLYDEDELILPDTQPQILRSSLDLVVLQLISLGLNSHEFPFMDPPKEDHIEASLDLLKQLSCVDDTGKNTLKGELFAKLGIDPRNSAFLLDTYLEHEPILELVAIIVAISIAPGSVFSITGETKEEKENGRDRIANNARRYNSDVFYSVSVYKDWRDAGALDPETRACRTCPKVYKKEYSCGPCRAAYSTTHLLNNKVLNYVENMSTELVTTMKDPVWRLEPSTLSDANESDIIGANFYKNFPERYGRLEESSITNKHAVMIQTKFRAAISDLSTFYQRKTDHCYFIATSMTKIPGDKYKIDRLHPFRAPNDSPQDDVTE